LDACRAGELRDDFRSFRLDRMRDPELAEPFVSEPDKTLAVFLERIGTIDRN